MTSPVLLTREQVKQLLAEVVPRDVLDTEEAAAYLRVSKQLLEMLRVTGDGPRYAKLGRLVRYRRASLDAWVLLHERNNSSETS